ncbi:hypothetical protein EVAR_33722_1 [Eumeta japonica]|uniref:Uncharacterized protein n=1 Tax=Eumeta variegata TaxID=151549 RepID=A0A4C1VSS1_EUMVA|nr:hypothetical protein EVAR_33722_1 [Eumeta japonica]
MIDFILVDDRLGRKVIDTKVYRGVNVSTNHFLAVYRIKALCHHWRYHVKRGTIELGRIKIGKLQDPNVKDDAASLRLFNLFLGVRWHVRHLATMLSLENVGSLVEILFGESGTKSINSEKTSHLSLDVLIEGPRGCPIVRAQSLSARRNPSIAADKAPK